MFSQLAVPMAVFSAMLLVPGYLFLRLFRLPRTWAVCASPIVTMGLVGILGEVYGVLGIPSVPLTVLAPLIALCGAIHLVRIARAKSAGKDVALAFEASPLLQGLPTITWWLPLLFVAVGLFVCNNVFLSELEAPDAILQFYDVTHHLNVIQAFFEARRTSSIAVSPYLTTQDAAIMPYGIRATYPSGWYALCALLMHATGVSTPVAINASMGVFTGVVLPLAGLLWATLIFGRERHSVIALALTGVSFVTFPWCMLMFGPLYPNLAGFTALPATAALFMIPFLLGTRTADDVPQDTGQTVKPGQRVLFAVPFVIASAGQALLHPNTLFSIFLMLIPFCACYIYDQLSLAKGKSKVVSATFAGLFVAICAAVWAACFFSPAFDDIVGEYWPSYAYSWQEVINILTQTYVLGFFNEITAQVVLGVLVIIGWVRCVYRRSTLWLALSYVIVCGINFIGATSASIFIKQFVTGFWYTDSMRLAAMACLLAALLAADGLAWVFETLCELVQAYNTAHGRRTHPLVIATVLGIAFFVQNFMPGFNWPGAHQTLSDSDLTELRIAGKEYQTRTVKTTFGDFRQLVHDSYGINTPIDEQELEFLHEVGQLVPTGALVINNPMDGSFLAYGTMGLRVYYREFGYANTSTETPQSVLVRTSLCNMATDANVRATVEELGAQYVLVMSEKNSSWSFVNLRGDYSSQDFAGISSITPGTPGFTPLLTNGACALYRID